MFVRYGRKSQATTLRSSAILGPGSSASTAYCMQAAPMVRTLRSELRSLSMSGASNAGVESVKPSLIFPVSTTSSRGSHPQSNGKDKHGLDQGRRGRGSNWRTQGNLSSPRSKGGSTGHYPQGAEPCSSDSVHPHGVL